MTQPQRHEKERLQELWYREATTMTFRTILVFGCAIYFAAASALAAEEGVGVREFKENCAICHGVTGKGDGPLTEFLKAPLPNLRVLSKNNDGVFPFERVYQIIDGRDQLKAHGPKDMPVWGNKYNKEAAEYYHEYYGKYDSEAFIQGKILALVVYIHSLQDK